MITFKFLVKHHKKRYKNERVIDEIRLQFPSMSTYQYKEEFSYAYSKQLQPIQLLYTYGMHFSNNPYAMINIPQTNFFPSLTLRQKEMCLAIGCLDPKYYSDVSIVESVVLVKGQGATDFYRNLQYSLEQSRPLNPYHMNLFRVFALDERAPNILGRHAAQLGNMNSTVAQLKEEGIIVFEAELVAIFNLVNHLKNVLQTKTSVKEDIRAIQAIEKDINYQSDQTKRRQIISLKVAISNKQTVQVGLNTAIERGIDLLHRQVLNALLLPSDQLNHLKYSFLGFDTLQIFIDL
ncbi:hypothetical protein FGO68_gene164 [Halteria grandinella]|uniref:Uncharacterized protein n=1 Tax=Halteria grandinella TaxID=5974 RepID=A0A8J8NTE1_HALGN|nr:hypothetical protein FGO68_gene164 [Halteria grandinella]